MLQRQLSVLEAHFSDPYGPSYFFFLWLFSGYWAWWELGRRVRHHPSSLPVHLLWLKRPLLLKHIQFIPQWTSFYTVFKKALHGVEHLSKVPPEESRAQHLRNAREAALGAVRVVLTPKPAPPVGYRLDPIACWQTQCLVLMAKETQEECTIWLEGNQEPCLPAN